MAQVPWRVIVKTNGEIRGKQSVVAVDTIYKVFVYEALPISTKTQQDGFRYVSLLLRSANDPFRVNNFVNESSIARYCLVKGLMVFS